MIEQLNAPRSAGPQGQSTQVSVISRPVQPSLTTNPIAINFDLQSSLLFAAVENCVDGLMIVSQSGEILLSNRCAHTLLKTLSPSGTMGNTMSKLLPSPIWRLCKALLDDPDREEADFCTPNGFPSAIHLVLEDEIVTANQETIRLRAQWFALEVPHEACFLVTLENCTYSANTKALSECQRYGLTPCEAKVWQLRRANLSYKEIANQLFVSENTVKKHLKSIYAKRELALGE
jgi:DNA-binding CsgD family transcriptional regulator